ncbi:hypothetical protein [Streptomyces sp. AC627_RSS907]|uniref:hypothetical protein n=1 Tax=Streptomyces sp. AC627_RSS907 TaxID=2823684 RepID=UPI001C22E32A|nr:hypothetical protein [Streptomyces sp. AC627_RSS907]
MSRYGITGAAAALALLALTGCGSSSDGGDEGGDGGATPAARDKGPACVGTAPADGAAHVLRGGGFKLPGGGGVQYAGADADGTTRTATLRDGATYASGQQQWKVEPGAEITVSGHGYSVRQICAYRVVLEPKTAEDRAALATAPKSLESQQGPADAGLCFTTNRTVLAAAAKGFPARGAALSLLDNGGVQRFPTGLSLTVSYIDPDSGTTGIDANCGAIPVADYKDVRVGETVEFAGVLFEVSQLTDQAVRLVRTSA